MKNTQVILGPPGTGKTTTLLNIVEKALESGVNPDKIGYVSFTKKASQEAKTRAKAKFSSKYPNAEFKYFRTLHSLAHLQLGLNHRQVMTKKHIQAFADLMNLELSGSYEYGEMLNMGTTHDDKVLAMENLARITMRPIEEVVHNSDEDIGLSEVEYVEQGLKEYKTAHGLLDFTDFLVKASELETVTDFDLLVVDEAQDLSALQWKFVEKLAENSKEIYIAGDDDQAIFKWNGADPDYLYNLDVPKKTLTQSWRVPQRIHYRAQLVITNIEKRIEKYWKPRQRAEGNVYDYGSVEQLELSVGEWYILARNEYLLKEVKAFCQTMGYYYSFRGETSIPNDVMTAILAWEKWEGGDTKDFEKFYKGKEMDKDPSTPWYEALDNIPPFTVEYIRGMLHNGEKLSAPPRITISTIHGVKGGEADNVALITDMAPKTYDKYVDDPDDENRVLYVALTRARENLHIIDPQTSMHYDF
jgi:DNA helicase-2/ATP-dependent DNA helicase PcrA